MNAKDDWLRLRWRHSGKRYELRPGLIDNRQNRVFADRLARSIEIDLLSGHFDPTLEKYKPTQKATEVKKVMSIIDLYEEWLKYIADIGTGKKTVATMRSLINNLEHYHNPSQFIQWLGINNKAITVKRIRLAQSLLCLPQTGKSLARDKG